jgi:hypothetical protein
MTASELIVPVFWAGATHLAMWIAGSWLRARLLPVPPADESPSQRAFQSAMLGFALLGSAAFVLGALRLLYAPVLAGLIAILAAAGIVRIVRARPGLPRRPSLADIPLIASIAFVLAHLPNALYPVLEHDENVYHLLIPKLYLASHGMAPLPWTLGANMPHLVDLSFVLPTAFGGFTAAKVFVLGFILWTIVGLASFGREVLGPMGPGVLAVLYLSGRVIQWHLGLAYVEPVIGAVMLAGLQALRAWWDDRSDGHLLILGVLAGAGCASKYTVWPTTVVLFAIVALVRGPSGRRVGFRAVAMMVGLTALLVAPWLVKNAIVTGNPIFPNAGAVFHSPYWSKIQDVQFQHEMGYGRGADRSVVNYLTLPLRLVTDDYTGSLGTAAFSASFMALLLASMAFPWRRGEFKTAVRILAIAAFVFWCLGSKQGRYMVAWVPVMIVAAAIPLAPLRRRGAALVAVTIAVVAVAIVQIRLQPYPKEPVMDVFAVPRAELLSRNLCWDLTEYLNRTVPPGAGVLSFWENRLYFLDRPFVTDGAYGAPTAMARLREAGDAHAFARTLADEGITHVVINPYQYRSYMGNGYLYSLIDERDFTESMLHADNELFDRFVDTEIEGLSTESGWPVGRLKVAAHEAPR